MRYTLGIIGPPGSGKSHLAAYLRDRLRAQTSKPVAAALPMDGFHLPDADLADRNMLDRKGSPDSFDRAGFAARLRSVRRRGHHTWPDYDRRIHAAVPDAIDVPRSTKLLVVEGNYLGLWPEVRSQLDECWYLDTDRATCTERLYRRHVAGGRTPAAAAERIVGNDLKNAHIVAETRAGADLVVSAAEVLNPVTGAEILARLRGYATGLH